MWPCTTVKLQDGFQGTGLMGPVVYEKTKGGCTQFFLAAQRAHIKVRKAEDACNAEGFT